MKSKKPEWVSTFVDQAQYKLSQAELMQKKISLVSKHRKEAKDEWMTVQNKLKHNILDQDTQKIYETALQSKGLSNSTTKRKNLTQMIEWERQEKLSQTKSVSSCAQPDVLEQAKALLGRVDAKENHFIQKVKSDIQEAKTLVNKAQRLKEPERILKAIENSKIESADGSDRKRKVSMKDSSKKKLAGGEVDFTGFKNLDNVISFLENTLQQEKQQEEQRPASSLNERPPQVLAPRGPEEGGEQKSVNLTNPFTNALINESAIRVNELENTQVVQRLNFDNMPRIQMQKNEISFDDNIDQLKQMLEMTRQELNQMNLQDPSFVEPSFIKEGVRIQERSFDMRQIHKKYRNTNTFDIHDHLA